MGNAMTACCLTSEGSYVKIIYWEGNTKTLTGKQPRSAGEIMFEFPDSMVCDSNRFFIGHPIPSLTIDDPLEPGQTYFVLPLDIFSSKTVSASSISAMAGNHMTPKRAPINFKDCPFEYIKGSNGRVLIKISSLFMERILTRRDIGCDDEKEISGSKSGGDVGNYGLLCSTPELKKQYEHLVGCKDQTWSPKLETISEKNNKIIRYSPYRLIGLEWKD